MTSVTEAGRTLTTAAPILVTGGAGFIGSNFVLAWFEEQAKFEEQASSEEHAKFESQTAPLINLDKLTYAGNPANLASLAGHPATPSSTATSATPPSSPASCAEHKPRAIVHFAAESHVDRSITGPEAFLRTNIDGTFTLLQAARAFYDSLPAADQQNFRFLHVSTDEVYGTLSPTDPAFHEDTPYAPTPPTPPPRPPPTTSSAPGTTPTACPPSSPTAPTTTARSTSPKNSSRS